MRLDKTVARIFLIFSVANVALAAPVVDLQDVAKYATTVSEKRVSSDEGSTFTPSASGGSSSSSSVEMHPGTSTPEFLYGWEAEMRAQGMGAPGSDSEESLVSDHYSSEHSSLNSGGFLQAHGDDAASLPSTHHSTPPVSPPPPNHVSWTMPSSSSSHPDNLAPSVAPEVDRFFSDGMKQKLKGFALLGTAAGVVYGVNKFADKLYSRAETIGRDLASSNSRGANTPLHGPPDHPQRRKKPVSRGLANLRDEDFRFPNVLTRRGLGSLI